MERSAHHTRLLWLPVSTGAAICIYFALPAEPPAWLGAVLMVLASVAAVVAKGRWRQVMLIAAFGALGLALIQLRTAQVAAPVMQNERYFPALTGQVLWVDERPLRQRVLMKRSDNMKVRVSLLPGAVRPMVGDWITVPARIGPPKPPVAPGTFDFQRYAYYLGLGGLGYALGNWQEVEPSPDSQYVLPVLGHLKLVADRLRARVADRVRAALGAGAQAGIVKALMIGDRTGIPEDVLHDWRAAGLAHMLAISGLHMSLFSALAFVGIRRVLALMPPVALCFDIKKLAAFAALIAAAGYLMLSGMNVPAQRAFMMVAVALIAVLADRQALSLHTLAVAALLILCWRPEAVIGASFQMSFAAVLGLITAYEVFQRARVRTPDTSPTLRTRIGVYALGIVITTVVSEVATAPFGAYHFSEMPSYGVVGNLPAMPVLVFWVMPSAVLSLLAMPMGWEAAPLWLMGQGVDVISGLARGIADLPGAFWRPPPVSPFAMAAFSLGGIGLCLMQGWGRITAGVAGICGLVVIAILTPVPDLWISADGRLLTLRTSQGLVFSPTRGHKFARQVMVERFGDVVQGWDDLEHFGVAKCDQLGCVLTHNHARIAYISSPEGLADDCARVDVLIAQMPVRRACASKRDGEHLPVIIDRFDLWRYGAHGLYLNPNIPSATRIITVRDYQGERPWTRFPEKPVWAR